MALSAWSAAEVYEAETLVMATMADGELLQRAVTALVERVANRLQNLAGRHGRAVRVVALVGGGNNGADAAYTAARLAAGSAWRDVLGSVDVVATAPTFHAGAHAALAQAGVEVHRWGDTAAGVLANADLVIDGIMGLGARGGLPTSVRDIVEHVSPAAWVVAVDIPSGIPADAEWGPSDAHSGDLTVVADETIAIGTYKCAHLGRWRQACGALDLVDIGVTPTGEPRVVSVTQPDVMQLWPRPSPSDHKYRRGVVGIVGGTTTYPGAAVLATVAAAEVGAGLVRVAASAVARQAIAMHVPEAVPVVGDDAVPRCQAWVVGPGLVAESTDDESLVALAQRIIVSDVPCVLDAGALPLFTGPRQADTLLTPHAGELAALLNRLEAPSVLLTATDVMERPVYWARRLADRTEATVLLKGAVTYVVNPQHREPATTMVSTAAPAWLATAGAGDVLAGVCGVLLAAGLNPQLAGVIAATTTGSAAHHANPGGPVRALRVAHSLPRVLAAPVSHPKEFHD